MSIKKVTLASLILLSLTACSSGGGGGSSSPKADTAKENVVVKGANNEKLNQLEAEINKTKQELADALKKAQDLANNTSNTTNNEQALADAVKKAEEAVQKVQDIQDKLNHKNTELNELKLSLEEAKNNHTHLAKQLADALNSKDLLAKEIAKRAKQTEEKINTLKNDVSVNQAELAKAKQDYADLTKQIEDLKKENIALASSMAKAEKMANELQLFKDQIIAKEQERNNKIQALKERALEMGISSDDAESFSEDYWQKSENKQKQVLFNTALQEARKQARKESDGVDNHINEIVEKAIEDYKINTVSAMKEYYLKASSLIDMYDEFQEDYQSIYDFISQNLNDKSIDEIKAEQTAKRNERLEKERLEREKRLDELKNRAITAGLSEEEAKAFAENHQYSQDSYIQSDLDHEIKSKAMNYANSLNLDYSVIDYVGNYLSENNINSLKEMKDYYTKAAALRDIASEFQEENTYEFISQNLNGKSIDEIKAEKIAKRNERLDEIKNRAIAAGLSEEEAKEFAEKHQDPYYESSIQSDLDSIIQSKLNDYANSLNLDYRAIKDVRDYLSKNNISSFKEIKDYYAKAASLAKIFEDYHDIFIWLYTDPSTFISSNLSKSIDNAKEEAKETSEKFVDLKNRAINAGLSENEVLNFAIRNTSYSKNDIDIEIDLAEKVALKNGMDKVVVSDTSGYLANQSISDKAEIQKAFTKVAELEKLAREQNWDNYKKSLLVRKNLEHLDSDKLDLSLDYPLGLSVTSEKGSTESESYTKNFIYNQNHSVIYATYSVSKDPNSQELRKKYEISGYDNYSYNIGNGVRGDKLSIDSLPNEGQATYTGKAFNADKQGDFTYSIDFAKRTGSGKVSNLAPELPEIKLLEGKIETQYRGSERVASIESKIEIDKGDEELYNSYSLNFYGPQAKEIAGIINVGSYPGSDYQNRPEMVARHNEKIEKLKNAGFVGKYGDGSDIQIGIAGSRGEIKK